MSRSRTHSTLKNGPMDYVLKRLLMINIIWYSAISAVYPLLYISREIEYNLEE